jgi:hypothetical protein
MFKYLAVNKAHLEDLKHSPNTLTTLTTITTIKINCL